MAHPRKSRSKGKTPSRHNSNTVRIIGGKWRGRKLRFPGIEGLRPTGDSVRETLFNWLTTEIAGANVIDLFAGSGALGFESLSREASQVTFVEMDSRAATFIQKNIELLDASSANVQPESAFDYLKTAEPNSCDLLFLDPPFADELHNGIVSAIERQNIMKHGALVYIEAPANCPLRLPANWTLHRSKNSGQVCYRLFHCSFST